MSEPRRTGLLRFIRESVGCQFVIPVFQRNYTWKSDEQVKQYLTDLKLVLMGKHKNHFLGIMIYLEKTIDYSSREFSIVDGQQRMTTTFLILYAIKKILMNKEDYRNVEIIDNQYLTNKQFSDNIKYKLKPLVSDDDVYKCIVEDRIDEIEDKNSNVFRNYEYICKNLNDWLREYDVNQILLAMEKLYLVCIPISEEDDAQKIFESINATGAKLTAADLIRNYLLMGLQSSLQEDFYKNYWKKIEENVSQDSKILELFFRMFLAIKTFNLVPKNSVYREFMAWVEMYGLQKHALLEELLEYSKIYSFLFKSSLNTLPIQLQTALTDYRKINSDIPMAAAIEFCRLCKNKNITEETLGEIISSINAYLLRRSICDMNSQNISKLFPTVLKKVMDKCDEDYSSIVQILNQELVGNNAITSGSYMPTDKQMHDLLHTANVYKRPSLRIILDRMELDNNSAPVDLSSLSVEHLMPQTPTDIWLKELNTDLDTYNNNLHRIGNLTLATKPDNSKMKNKVWEYKNEVIKKTAHLKMNMELMDIAQWDLTQIEERSNKMIEKICQLYPYPNVKTAEVDEDEIDETEALNIALEAVHEKLITVKRGSAYKSYDNKNGYIFSVSKMYPQGDKKKYWFGYREKRFNILSECENLNLVLICKHKSVITIKLPISFLEKNKERLIVSRDEDENIRHYHIVIFDNPDSTVSMLLSVPETEEIDITEYVCS